MLMGIYRNGRFFAIHTDHLGTPRLMTNDVNKPVWQWPYSAFGTTNPTGVLQVTPKPKEAMTNQPKLLKATAPAQGLNLGFPGWYRDAETNTFYNYQRDAVTEPEHRDQQQPVAGVYADTNAGPWHQNTKHGQQQRGLHH